MNTITIVITNIHASRTCMQWKWEIRRALAPFKCVVKGFSRGGSRIF